MTAAGLGGDPRCSPQRVQQAVAPARPSSKASPDPRDDHRRIQRTDRHGIRRLERTPGVQPMSDINMTPLIDVMLVPLVIFRSPRR
jgi:hypothetical protein